MISKKIIFCIIFIIVNMAKLASTDNLNEDYIGICKISKDTIRIDYFSSVHGISKVCTKINGDTLNLNLLVRVGKKQDSHFIKINENIKVISTGNIKYYVNDLDSCGQLYEGIDAIEYLKKQRTE